MFFLGDCHGQIKTYLWATSKMLFSNDREGMPSSLQLGDMGIFRQYDYDLLPELKNHKFIRGNHDNPELCKTHPNYLGDFGYNSGIFFVSGGYSIDYRHRREGVNWWRNEELGYTELNKAIELYKEIKPSVVVSHECPTEAKCDVLIRKYKINIASKTEKALQVMLETHRPDLWVFGHHHQKVEKRLKGTMFVCLNEMKYAPIKECIYEVPGLEWKAV